MSELSVTVPSAAGDATSQAEQQQQQQRVNGSNNSGITVLPPSNGDNWTTVAGGLVWKVVDEDVWTLGDLPWIPAVLVGCGMAVLLSLSFYSHHKRVRRRRELLMDYLSTLLYSGVFTRGRSVSFLCNTNYIALADLGGSFRIKDDRVDESNAADQVIETELRDWITFSKGEKKRKKGLKRFVSSNEAEPNFRRVASQVYALNKTSAMMSWKGRVGFTGSMRRNLSMPLGMDSCSFDVPSSLSEVKNSITKGVLLDPNKVQQQDFGHNLGSCVHDPLTITASTDENYESSLKDMRARDANLRSTNQLGQVDVVNAATHSFCRDGVSVCRGENQASFRACLDQTQSWKSQCGHPDDKQSGWNLVQNQAPSSPFSLPKGSVSDPKFHSAVLQARDEVTRDKVLAVQQQTKQTPPLVHSSSFATSCQSKFWGAKNVSQGSFWSLGNAFGKQRSEESEPEKFSVSAKDVSVSVTQSSALLTYKHALRPVGTLCHVPRKLPTLDPHPPSPSLGISPGNDSKVNCLNLTESIQDARLTNDKTDSVVTHASGTEFIRRPYEFPCLTPWKATKSNVKHQNQQHPYCALRPVKDTSASKNLSKETFCSELTFCSSEAHSVALGINLMDRKIPYLISQGMQVTYTKSLEESTNRSPRRFPLPHSNDKSTEYAPLLPGEADSSTSCARTVLPPALSYCTPLASSEAEGKSVRLPVYAPNPSVDGTVTKCNDFAGFSSDEGKAAGSKSDARSNITFSSGYGASPDFDADPVSQIVPQRFPDLREKTKDSSGGTANSHRPLHRFVFSRAEEQQERHRGKERPGLAERKQNMSWQAPAFDKNSLGVQRNDEPEAFSGGTNTLRQGHSFKHAVEDSQEELPCAKEGHPEQNTYQQRSNLYRLPRFQVRSGFTRHRDITRPLQRSIEVHGPKRTPEQQPPQQSNDGTFWKNTLLDTSI